MLLDGDRDFINQQRDQRLEKAVHDAVATAVPQAVLPAWPDDEAVFGTARLNRQAILRERDARLERESQLQKAADPYHLGGGQSGGGQFTSAAEAGGASPIPQPPKPPQPGAHAAVAPVKTAPVTKPVSSHGGMKPATPLGGGGRGPQPTPVKAKPKPKPKPKPKATPKKVPAPPPPKSTGSGRKPAKQELSEVRAEIISADAKLADLRQKKKRLVAAGSASTSSGGPAKSGTSMGAGAGAGAAAGASASSPSSSGSGSTASSTSSSTASATTKTPSAQYAQQIHQLDQEINDTIVQIQHLKQQEQQLLHQ